VSRHWVVRMLGWLLAGLAVAATAFSRVELGVHWTTDVTASVNFAAGWVAAITLSLGATLRR
jgi:membrane-associated phospholipid phosphatase